MPDIKFAQTLVFVNSAVPASLLAWDAYHHRLGTNPPEFVLHTTGTLALVFLLLTLAVTPLRKILGLPWMVRFRRMMGLWTFFYASLHLLAYSWFDKGFAFRAIVEDTFKRRFIFVGMFAFVLMIPLAVTSTSKMLKQLGGRRWNRLHKLIFPAAIAGTLHYYWLVKADVRLPLAFSLALAFLLAYRMLNKFFPSATERRPKRQSA
ncbi:MAG: sulfite oxidase heme-binding subunit YedZ [Blastocatellia bacterium]